MFLPEGDYLTVRQLSRLWRKPKDVLWRWVREGKLPCRRVGRYVVLIRREDVQDFSPGDVKAGRPRKVKDAGPGNGTDDR